MNVQWPCSTFVWASSGLDSGLKVSTYRYVTLPLQISTFNAFWHFLAFVRSRVWLDFPKS